MCLCAVGVVYYAMSRSTHLTCESGVDIRRTSAGITDVTCSNPAFEISCSRGSFIKIESEIECTGAGKKFLITDQFAENFISCKSNMGELASFNGSSCICAGISELRDGKCFDIRPEKDFFCKTNYGTLSIFNEITKDCKCQPGSYRDSQTEEPCIPLQDWCSKRFGPSAKARAPYHCWCPDKIGGWAYCI